MSVELEDRVRRALAHRAEHTSVDASSLQASSVSADRRAAGDRDAVVVDIDRAGRAGRAGHDGRAPVGRRLVLVGAAAALVVGVVVLSQRIEPPVDEASPPASVPATPAASRFSLSLDDRRVLPVDDSGVPADRYVLDPTSVPEGWTVDESGMSTLYSGSEASLGFIYTATLSAPDGTEVGLLVARMLGDATPPEETLGTVDGFPAWGSDGPPTTVTWKPDPDVTATVQGTGSVADLMAFADSLEYRRVASFAATWSASADDDAFRVNEANVQFSGSISGLTWAVEVEPGPLRTVWSSIAGRRSGGTESDRQSQPTDAPVTVVENNLDATPGVGAVIYGWGPASLTSVAATLADGSTVSFPTYQRELEAFFAVPIPVGVRVTTLTYLAGDEVHTVVEVPELPADLGGVYGGVPSV